MLKINVRQFNRKMYLYLKDLPIIVYNKKTGMSLFVVYPIIKEGSDVDAITKSKQRKSRV